MSTTNERPNSPASEWLWRISSILFVIWGLVHVLAGVMTIGQLARGNAADAVYAITPKTDQALIEIDYPDAVVAILSQHGFNLLWGGLAVTVAAIFVWRRHAILFGLAAIVGGCLDLGYFIFIDLGGFAEFPGPQMTYICAAAIVLGIFAIRLGNRPTAVGSTGSDSAANQAA